METKLAVGTQNSSESNYTYNSTSDPTHSTLGLLSFQEEFSPANNATINRTAHPLSRFPSEFSLDSKATEDMKHRLNTSIPLPKNQSSSQSFTGLSRGAFSLNSMDSYAVDGHDLHSLEINTSFTADEDNDNSTKTNGINFESYDGTTTSSLALNQDVHYLDEKKNRSTIQSSNSILHVNIQKTPSSPSNSSSSLASGRTTNSTTSAITTTNSNASKESHLSSTKSGDITDRTRSIASSIATSTMTKGIRKMALNFDTMKGEEEGEEEEEGEGKWSSTLQEEESPTKDLQFEPLEEIIQKENHVDDTRNDNTEQSQKQKWMNEEEKKSFPNMNTNKTEVSSRVETSSRYEKRNHDWDQNLNLDLNGPFNVPLDGNIDLSLIDDTDEEILRTDTQLEDERHNLDIIKLDHNDENHLDSMATRPIIMEHNSSNAHIHPHYRYTDSKEHMNVASSVTYPSNVSDHLHQNVGNKYKNANDTNRNKYEKVNERKDRKKNVENTNKPTSKSKWGKNRGMLSELKTSEVDSSNSLAPSYQVNDAFNLQLQTHFNNLTGGMENSYSLPLDLRNNNFSMNQFSMNLPVSSPQQSIPSTSDFLGVKNSTSNNSFHGPVLGPSLGQLSINPQGGPFLDNLINSNSLSSPLVSNIVTNPFSMAFFNHNSNPQSYSAPGSPNMDYHTMSRFNNGNKVNFISTESGNQTPLFSQKGKNKVKGQKSLGNNGVAHIKNKWGAEEDMALTKLVNDFGTKNWVVIATRLGTNRTGKQCRERWVNQLDPSICKEVWSPEEERILARAHEKFGNKWAKIAKLLPGRSDNACKNKINGAIKRHQKQKVTDITKKNISLSPSTKKSKGGYKKTLNGKKSNLDKTIGFPLDSSFLISDPLTTLSRSFPNSFTTSTSSVNNSRTTYESSSDNLSSPSSQQTSHIPPVQLSIDSNGSHLPDMNEGEGKLNDQTFRAHKSSKRSQEEAALRTSVDLVSNHSLVDLQVLDGKEQENNEKMPNKENVAIPRNVSLHLLEEDDSIKKRRLSVGEKEFKPSFTAISNNSIPLKNSNLNRSGSSNSNNEVSYQGQSHPSDEVDFDLDFTNLHEGNITSLLHFSND